MVAAQAAVANNELAAQSAEADVTVAEAERAQAEAGLSALSAARDLAQATLDKTFVRAPFDGIIVLKDAEVGEVVSPNAQGAQSRGSVATMVDPTSLEVQVELPETTLSSARIGERAEIFLDAFPDQRFQGTVLRIWPTANRQKATVEVRVGGADGVFVVERDVVRVQALTLGGTTGRRVEATSGIKEGERVVLDPPARLADGDRVRIKGEA